MNATMVEIPVRTEGETGGCAQHLDAIYCYVRALVASPHDAEDLTQETFRKAALHWPKIQSGDVRAWLFTTARNEVLQHYRRRGSEKRCMTEFQALLIERKSPDRPPSVPAESEVKQMHAAAQAAIDALDALEREAMRMKFVAGRSNTEIATALKITPNHLGVLLFRALKKVRQKLEDQGHEA